jgi:hypothetical protein
MSKAYDKAIIIRDEIQKSYDHLKAHYDYSQKEVYGITDKGYSFGLLTAGLICTQIIELEDMADYEMNAYGRKIKANQDQIITVLEKLLNGNLSEILYQEHQLMITTIKGLEALSLKEAPKIAGVIRVSLKQFYGKMDKAYLKSCYIATYVYRDYESAQVATLRKFRDKVLLKRSTGKLFVKLYYTISPYLIRLFGKYHIFHKASKMMLDAFASKVTNK